MNYEARRRLAEVRKAARYFKTSTYEISAHCNLKCEGCLYFSGEHAYQHTERTDAETWREFFRQEAERGITFAFLAGAEPSLVIDRLLAAWEFIPTGMVVTNGTRRIPEEIGFRIHVSVWGNEATTKLTRGANVTQKALHNYAFDPRAILVYTINKLNLDEIMPMVQSCFEHGLPLTFNYYSPTQRYQQELNGMVQPRPDYFRFSNSERNLVMGAEDYQRTKEIIKQAKAAYPDTIVYSMAYDEWVTSENMYELDDQGVASNCAGRSDRVHGTFFVDQTKSLLKCSNPTFDCRECRTYANGMTSHIRIEHQRMFHSETRVGWSDAFECWNKIFVGNQWPRLKAHGGNSKETLMPQSLTLAPTPNRNGFQTNHQIV